MSSLKAPLSIINFCSFLFRKDIYTQEDLQKIWSQNYGNFLIFSHNYFPMKKYYSKEMGPQEQLSRLFFVSTELGNRKDLVKHKLWADQTEQSLSDLEKRSLNIDPGYLSLENVVLATGKNYSHRIYLDQGVYAELTLVYQQPSFVATSWCYPDYAHGEVIDFFNWVRFLLLSKVKSSLA